MTGLDIRDIALEVNEKLMNLILPNDDEDMVTDKENKEDETAFKNPNVTATDIRIGLSSQTSPKTGQSSPKTSLDRINSSTDELSKKRREMVQEKEQPKFHLLSVLAVLIPHMKFTQQETRKETLRWIMWLHQQLPRRVCT